MTRAVRGAIKVAENTAEAVTGAVTKLVTAIQDKNGIVESDIVSIVFSQTRDITARNPAGALRSIGFSEVPLFCTQEPEYDGSEPRIIRVLVTYDSSEETPVPVYLDGAEKLRSDIPT